MKRLPTPLKNPGRVYLVGAGPGHPGLITRRGLACLRSADVVVYDRLIPPALLGEAPIEAERICVAKSSGSHRITQREIETILVDRARAGQSVVRLKGGDPFVLGRGGEEALALEEAGIPFEIVPGVTSAAAVPAYAGIPLTHRSVSDGFAVWTGHRKAGEVPDVIDAPTQVILMGVATLPETVTQLLTKGRPPSTPAAVISWGTTIRQETVVGTLGDIVQRARAAGIGAPATIVVGDVAALATRLGWWRRPNGPLAGKQVVLTRHGASKAELDGTPQTDPLVTELEGLGAEVTRLPLTTIERHSKERIEKAAGDMTRYDIAVFTHPEAVRAVLEARITMERDLRELSDTEIVAAGDETDDTLRQFGIFSRVVPEIDAIFDAGETKDKSVIVLGVQGLNDQRNNSWGELPRGLDGRFYQVWVAREHPATRMLAALYDLVQEEMVDAVVFDCEASVTAFEQWLNGRPELFTWTQCFERAEVFLPGEPLSSRISEATRLSS